MTYRYVPKRSLQIAQLATLAVTSVMGAGILATPARVRACYGGERPVHLTALETTMQSHWWAYCLIAAGAIGLLLEAGGAAPRPQSRFG
jgi:hypothetical protein